MYERPPQPPTRSGETIQLADWIELNVLTKEEPVVSVTDITAMIAADPPDDSTTSEHRLDYPESLEDLDPTDLKMGYWQQAENTAELAFAELRQRSKWFGARYPLTVEGEIATASSCFDSGTVASFLTLLRSRHLYRGALDDDGKVAGEVFEELLPHALRAYLCTTEDASIRFGVAGGSRGSGLPLHTDDALNELSRRMHEPRGDLTGLPDGRDYGGDGIAWKALCDSQRGKLIAIGQATISEQEWTKKQPSPKWKSGRLIRFLAQPMIVVAFVESISLTTNTMLDGLPEEFSALPLDRFRILCILRDRDIPNSLRSRMEDWASEMLGRLPR